MLYFDTSIPVPGPGGWRPSRRAVMFSGAAAAGVVALAAASPLVLGRVNPVRPSGPEPGSTARLRDAAVLGADQFVKDGIVVFETFVEGLIIRFFPDVNRSDKANGNAVVVFESDGGGFKPPAGPSGIDEAHEFRRNDDLLLVPFFRSNLGRLGL